MIVARCFQLLRCVEKTRLGDHFGAAMDAAKRADACIECGECEPKCPNDLPIIEQLQEVTGKLGEYEYEYE